MLNELLWFLELIQNFSVKLIAVELLLCWRLPKRRCFALRLVLPCLVALSFSTQFSALMPWREYGGFSHWPPFWLGSYFNYGLLIVFGLSCLAMFACFELDFDWLLLYCVSGYVIQNLGYQIVESFRYRLFGHNLAVDYMLVSTALNAALFIVLAKFFHSFYVHHDRGKPSRQFIVAYGIVSLMLVAEYSQLITVTARTNTFFHIYAALINTLLLVLQVSTFRKGSSDLEKQKLEEIIQKMKWQQEFYNTNVEALNRKCHDLKHEISALRDMPRAERAVNVAELERALELYDNMYLTGCKPLDTLLTEERLVCEAHGIDLHCVVDGALISFISPVDIHILFGNALDNAIEAERGEPEGSRMISVSVKRREATAVIAIENYFSRSLTMSDGIPQTSKQDKENHGYGIKSMKLIVERYGGHLSFSAANERFSTVILLPIPENT